MSTLASHAAALAAFKAQSKDKEPPRKNQKFTLPKPSAIEALPTIPKKVQLRSNSIKLPKLKTTINSNGNQQTRNKSPSRTPTRTTPVQTPTRAPTLTPTTPVHTRSQSIDYFTLPREAVYLSPEASTMRRSTSNQSNLTLNKARAQETISNLKKSLDSKTQGKDASSKRISQEYSPQEMLNRIKHSFNSSHSSASMKSKDHQDRINEIRESIDLKRIQTQIKPPEDEIDEDSIGIGSRNGSTVTINSSNSGMSTPMIITTDADKSPNLPPSTETDTPSIMEDKEHEEDLDWKDSDALEEPPSRNLSVDGNETFQRPLTPTISHGSVTSPISPINIPPSLGATAREVAAHGSTESLPHTRIKLQSIDSGKGVSDDSLKTKPKRKPPPVGVPGGSSVDSDFAKLNIQNDNMSRSLVDYGSSLSESEFDTVEMSNESSSKLPQFPSLEEKHHHYLPHKRDRLKKKYKLHGGQNIDLSGLEFDTDPLATPGSTRSTTPLLTHQNQPVQLKTTMRKVQKKSKAFNEDKPWKHHTDLSYVSDNERKRYEGLWASNKGLYINKAVTKLRGVSYDSSAIDEENGSEDPSMRAAQLSSSLNKRDMSIEDEHNHFHNLDRVGVDQLILGSVVKRLWNRSKLPEETLEQIWNLVDFRGDGTLNKHEFLVGMWLIDQCLYGRKLPKKVDPAVWASLESIGLTINKKGKR